MRYTSMISIGNERPRRPDPCRLMGTCGPRHLGPGERGLPGVSGTANLPGVRLCTKKGLIMTAYDTTRCTHILWGRVLRPPPPLEDFCLKERSPYDFILPDPSHPSSLCLQRRAPAWLPRLSGLPAPCTPSHRQTNQFGVYRSQMSEGRRAR